MSYFSFYFKKFNDIQEKFYGVNELYYEYVRIEISSMKLYSYYFVHDILRFKKIESKYNTE